jgi:hypothetical protein
MRLEIDGLGALENPVVAESVTGTNQSTMHKAIQ